MKISRDVVDYVAALAKLHLGEDEKETLADQLRRILDFVEQLDEVDVMDVPPTKHVIGQVNVSRTDEPGSCLTQQEALAPAPDAESGHFVVPEILPG